MGELQILGAKFSTLFRSSIPHLFLLFYVLQLSLHRPSLLRAATADSISVPMATVTVTAV
jgi:hypothetical protein